MYGVYGYGRLEPHMHGTRKLYECSLNAEPVYCGIVKGISKEEALEKKDYMYRADMELYWTIVTS